MEQVKKLREMTGAGVMDCKKALEASQGDLEKAIELLRHKGIASAERREGRVAKEGLIALEVQGERGAMIELNCETDFVARTDDFSKTAEGLARKVFEQGEGVVVQEGTQNQVRELSGKLGEKVVLSRGTRVEAKNGFVASYLHSNKRIGVLVVLEGKRDESVEQFGKDVAMQVAAARPRFVSREEIPSEILEREKEFFRGELTGKPPEMQDKIIRGKLEKWFEESCLLDQHFIKNDAEKIKDYLAATSRKAGEGIAVRRFVRFQLGA